MPFNVHAKQAKKKPGNFSGPNWEPWVSIKGLSINLSPPLSLKKTSELSRSRILDKEDQLMRKKSLPPELANEEGIPEVLEALQNAYSDPDVLALIAHREKLLASEARRIEIVCEEERKKRL